MASLDTRGGAFPMWEKVSTNYHCHWSVPNAVAISTECQQALSHQTICLRCGSDVGRESRFACRRTPNIRQSMLLVVLPGCALVGVEPIPVCARAEELFYLQKP